MEDSELLREFVERGSDPAFSTLVHRYADFVYSTAFRQLRDPPLAQEVAQTVFCLLVRKARSLSKRTALVGWLYRATCFAAADALRTERRRRERERKAAQMEMQTTDTDTAWEQLSPLLDDAMNQLGEKDRLAVLLRFFQRKPMREVGQALGISEDAAKMRVARAVERLRGSFARRGVACPAAIIAAVLSEKTMQAAPVALVQSLGTATMMKAAGGVTVSFLIINSLKFMARLNLKSAVATGIGLLVALNVGLYVYNASHRPIPKAASSQPNRRKPPVATGGANTGQANVAQSSSSAVDPALTAALENLRAVLREPWGARRRPDQKIRDALARFGPNRKAAVPVLMEALEQRDLGLQVSAAFGLQELGTDAAVALPELMALLRANRLAVLNDGFESLFAAINPGPNWISDLIDAIRQPNLMGRGRVANLIATLIQKNPGSETIYRPAVMALLQDPDPDARFYAAQALGKIPGAKETSAVPELISALKADALQDPHHYDPVFDPESSTTYIRKWEQQQDDMRRFEAVFGLESFGSDAKNAVPVLEEVANNTTNTELHALALEAIGTIDPEKRTATPEIDQLLTAKETGLAIAEKIRLGQAGFEELLEGLKYQNSVSAAAQAIGKLRQETIQTALPALRSALTTWEDYDAAQVIKQSDPQWLMVALKEPKAACEAAEALGELGPEARYALPALYEAMETGPTNHRYAIENAIKRIDPEAPRPLFHFDDLSPAVSELMSAAEAADKEIHDRVLDVYIKHGQDLNSVTRGEVIAFVNAIHDVDRGIYDLFVTKLVESNPSLAEALKPAP